MSLQGFLCLSEIFHLIIFTQKINFFLEGGVVYFQILQSKHKKKVTFFLTIFDTTKILVYAM